MHLYSGMRFDRNKQNFMSVQFKICIYSIGLIIFVALVYLCIKYKVNGILLSISYVGYMALLLIVLRYTNVMLSIDAMVGLIVMFIYNYIAINVLLKDK